MEDIHRRQFLFLGGVTGMASLAGCQLSSARRGNDPPEDTDARGLALSKSRGSELSESDDVHSGWVHVVADGETYDVTFDLRVCHGRQEEATVGLEQRVTNEYALEFETTGEADGESDCEYGTRITGGGTLPTEFEMLRVTANGRTLQTLENEGTMPRLRPLPDPLET